MWPLSDQFHNELYCGIVGKEMSITPPVSMLSELQHDNKNKDYDGDEKRDYTASGRKIVTFSDMQVSKKGAKFFCWPDKDKVYNWSTWADWNKIRPLCRMRFKHGEHMYGISLSPVNGDDTEYANRGFRGYDLTLQPPIQWLSKEENSQVMGLSLVDKFIKHCI